MRNSILLAVIIGVLFVQPAKAQGWIDNTGSGSESNSVYAGAAQGADQGNFTYKTGSDEAAQAGRGYVLENPARSSFGGWNLSGMSGRTSNQKLNLPKVVTAMPIVRDGVNTGLIGGSVALQTQYGPGVFEMPVTGTDSIVHQSRKAGAADLLFGGEGSSGPPPYNGFTSSHHLQNAFNVYGSGLSTGHPSDAPSAWGTPLKYNTAGGVIQGE